MFLDYSGYGYYMFYLPFIYLLVHKGYKLIDKTFCVLFMWGMLYALSVFIFSDGFGYVTTFIFFINFPFIYLLGKFLVRRSDDVSLINLLYIMALSMSAVAIVSVIKDVLENGFLVIGMGRNIPLIGIDNLGKDCNISQYKFFLGSYELEDNRNLTITFADSSNNTTATETLTEGSVFHWEEKRNFYF